MILAAPAVVWAQASIAGTVKDTSGAVLPGVTVEASSPALIEKIRTAVSDGTGQYRIENLRPGIYTVTFMLTGFSTVVARGRGAVGLGDGQRQRRPARRLARRDRSPSPASRRSWTCRAPQRQTVLTNEVIKAIPTAGSYNALLVLVPGAPRRTAGREHRALQLVHVQRARHAAVAGRQPRQHRRPAAGGRHQHRRAPGRRHQLPHRHAERAGSDLHGVGQHGRGGVGRAGDEHHPALGRQHAVGQRLRVVGQRRPAEQQPERRAAGRCGITPSPLIKSYDLSGAVGGPIARDRAWFFGTVRGQGNSSYITNMYYNKNAGDPNKWLYEPDL